MATGTNLEQDVLNARMQAAFERRNGNTLAAVAWDQEAETLIGRIVALETAAKWDVLKGSSHG